MSDKKVDQAQELYHNMLEERLRGTDAAVAAINELTAARVRKIPEVFFKSVLLPIVRSWLRKEPTAEIGVWLNVADGLNNPIEVVDEQNNLLFQVPPPFVDIPLITEPPKGRIVTADHLVRQQNEMINNGDTRGAMTIEGEISNIYSPRPEDESKAKFIMMLVGIYERYQLPMEELLGPSWEEVVKNKPSTIVTKNAVTDDDSGSEEQYIY